MTREALVGEDELAACEHTLLPGAFEHCRSDLPLPLVRWRQGEVDRHSVRCAQQIQPQTPEEPAVAGAIPVNSPACELRALDCLTRSATRHRVESNNLSRSLNDGEIRARWLMTRQILGASERKRLL